jgi:hypothetical protein
MHDARSRGIDAMHARTRRAVDSVRNVYFNSFSIRVPHASLVSIDSKPRDTFAEMPALYLMPPRFI